MTDQEYAELAARLTDPRTPLAGPSEVQTGEAAERAGHGFMLREYGSAEAIAQAVRRTGRPRAGQAAKGQSPTVRARISDVDFAAFKQLEETSGRTPSGLVRDAVHRYLVDHKLVS